MITCCKVFLKALLLTTLLTLSACCIADKKTLLAIDVGHSLAHPGATSARGQTEFSFNAALADSLYQFMLAHNISSVQIGHEGKQLSLTGRTAAAKQAGAGFFLSIHHDSVQSHYLKPWQWQGGSQQYADNFSGFSLFVSRKNPQLATSLNCASAIGQALQQKGLHPSAHHAEAIAGENKIWADQTNGVYYYDNLVVLKTAIMPAVLLEAGIIVNRQEEQVVQDTKTRQAIAEAVQQGLKQCHII